MGMNWSFWQRSFIADWLAVLALLVSSGLLQFFGPYHRLVLPNDASVQYPALDSIVPTWSLIFINFVMPVIAFAIFFSICFLILFSILFQQEPALSSYAQNLCLFQALSLTIFVTNAYKYYAGRPRPRWEQARATDPIDVWLSFPSGHSSSAFSAMTTLSLYLLGKFASYSAGGHFWQLIVSLLPMFGAGFVAISRTRDFHHNYDDIVGGAVLGVGISIATHFLHYHPLSTPSSGKPKLRLGPTANGSAAALEADIEASTPMNAPEERV